MSALPIAHAAFAGLIDYAGLFPPAALPIEAALAAYASASAGPHAWMLDRFIVPASRLADLARLYRGAERLKLSVILDVPSDALGWFEATRKRLAEAQVVVAEHSGLELSAIEVPLPVLRALRDSYDGAIGQFAALASSTGVRIVPAYLEIPRNGRWLGGLPATMTVLARHGFGAKVRCGGANPETLPSCAELGAFVRAATVAGVPFKATAGLHHPVRHVDPASGTRMHGFLNLIVASLIARDDPSSPDVEAALEEEDARAFVAADESFAWRERTFDVAGVTAMRGSSFRAYGSCSFDEPVNDLQTMRPRGEGVS